MVFHFYVASLQKGHQIAQPPSHHALRYLTTISYAQYISHANNRRDINHYVLILHIPTFRQHY